MIAGLEKSCTLQNQINLLEFKCVIRILIQQHAMNACKRDFLRVFRGFRRRLGAN